MPGIGSTKVCHSKSWRASARRLLRNLTSSQSATPTNAELNDLHITIQQYENDRLFGLHNIGVVRNFFLDPKRQIQARLTLMTVACPPCTPVEYHSRYTSSLLVNFICELSEHATRYMHDKRGQIRMKHDTYSNGALLDMNFAIPDQNGSICQYIAVVKRQRGRPESLPTGIELYSLLSLAAMFRKHRIHTEVVKVRLFIVYSSWVQVLSATAPRSYILSILAGKDHIEGDLEISESPWLNLLSLTDLERLLLFAFESATLTEHKPIPEIFLKRRQTLQSQSPKRKIHNLEGEEAKKRKTLQQ